MGSDIIAIIITIIFMYVMLRVVYVGEAMLKWVRIIGAYRLKCISLGVVPRVEYEDVVSLEEYVFRKPFEYRKSKMLKSEEVYEILKSYM